MDLSNINIIDVLIIAILGLSMVAGMYKGFMASGLTMVGFIASFFGAQTLYPQLANAILENTSLMKTLTYYLGAATMFETAGLGDQLIAGATQNGLLEQAVKDLQAIHLPDVLVNIFNINVNQEVFLSKGFTTFSDYLNQTIWSAAINVFAFVILFAVCYLLVLLVVNLLNNVFHFMLLKHFDWFLGGAFGLLRGYAIVALLLAVVPMAMSIIEIDVVDKLVAASQLAHYFPTGFPLNDIIAKAFR